jgi:hypothetical protein
MSEPADWRAGTGHGDTAKPVAAFFVYKGEARHVWRFVGFARSARTADEAIAQIIDEGRVMGNDVDGDYLAVPAPFAFTRTIGPS